MGAKYHAAQDLDCASSDLKLPASGALSSTVNWKCVEQIRWWWELVLHDYKEVVMGKKITQFCAVESITYLRLKQVLWQWLPATKILMQLVLMLTSILKIETNILSQKIITGNSSRISYIELINLNIDFLKSLKRKENFYHNMINSKNSPSFEDHRGKYTYYLNIYICINRLWDMQKSNIGIIDLKWPKVTWSKRGLTLMQF